MKTLRFMLGIGVFIFGITVRSFAQQVLPVIEITAVNYKYLNAVDGTEVAQPVGMLEELAASYDIKSSDFYEDQYDNYFVSFYIPEGKVLASYDKEGNLLRTAEKFKDVALPSGVRKAVVNRFPRWSISKDVYLVTYHEKSGATKQYKLLLENGNKRMRVKIDEKGEFL